MCVRLGALAPLPLSFAKVLCSLARPRVRLATPLAGPRRRLELALGCLLATCLSLASQPASAQLLDGLERWADTTAGLSSSKWGGPRVAFPAPAARPELSRRAASLAWPVIVHAEGSVAPARLLQVLDAAEATHALLWAAGFLTSFGDGGQGGSGARDLYVVDLDLPDAAARNDASGNFSALDGTRAFALLDARLPDERLLACTAQALIDAQLLELDPAEASSLRRSSAAYFAWLVTGEHCADLGPETPAQNPFLAPGAEAGARWLAQLAGRQDRDRGSFLFDMWQFARQRTWEGTELRASPDLIEAIDKALSLERDSFALVAAELSERSARDDPARTTRIAFSSLPWFSPKTQPALGVLGSEHVLLQLAEPHPGVRLRAWARGERGGRYVLTALRLDAEGQDLARLELESRKDPESQLSIELDARTTQVLVSVTRVADEGLPDADDFSALDLRPVTLTLDAPQ